MKLQNTNNILKILSRAQLQIDNYEEEWLVRTKLSEEQSALHLKLIDRYSRTFYSLKEMVDLFEVHIKEDSKN